MNEQDDHDAASSDLDAQMRATLRQHADDAPRLDLTGATLKRARRIRARRRAAVAGGALAVAAVVVPIGATIVNDSRTSDLADVPMSSSSGTDSDPASSGSPPVTDVALSDLARGDDPLVPYIFKTELVHDGIATGVPGAPANAYDPTETTKLVDAVAFSDGVGGFVTDTTDGSTSFHAGVPGPLPSTKGTTNPAIDSDGAVVFAVNGVGPSGERDETATVVYADSVSADPRFAATDALEVKQVMDVEDGVALLNATTSKGQQVVASTDFGNDLPGSVGQPWPNVVSLSAADQAAGLMAGRTTAMVNSEPQCNAMLSTDDATEVWRSCTWRPTEFSPDGSRVFAVSVDSDGFGVRQAAVLDARTGDVIRAFTTPGVFGRATFEPDNALDIVTVDGGDSAIVRCTEDGDCELATVPQQAAPDTLVVPYQLTANP